MKGEHMTAQQNITDVCEEKDVVVANGLLKTGKFVLLGVRAGCGCFVYSLGRVSD
jgi:hypothetical protein